MREFIEYENSVMDNIELDLVQGRTKYTSVDKKRGIWAEGNHKTCLHIGYVGKGENIVAKNTMKMVGLTFNERLGEKYIDIDFYIINDRYECASISFKQGDFPISIYDLQSTRFNIVTEPVVVITDSDDKIIIDGKDSNNKEIISTSEFTVEKMVNEICDFVRNIHDSKEWKDGIDSLLDAIKPALTLCVHDTKISWLNRINNIVRRCQRGIDLCDNQIEKLAIERLSYVKEYNLFKAAADALKQDEQEKIASKRKK